MSISNRSAGTYTKERRNIVDLRDGVRQPFIPSTTAVKGLDAFIAIVVPFTILEVVVNLSSASYSFPTITTSTSTTIDWGDGTNTIYPTGITSASHTYPTTDIYTIKVTSTRGLNTIRLHARTTKITAMVLSPTCTSLAQFCNGCSLLTDISGLSDLNASSVTTYSQAFNGCTQLSDLTPLTNIVLHPAVISCALMFNQCPAITSADALANWKVTSLTNGIVMFGSNTAISRTGNAPSIFLLINTPGSRWHQTQNYY